jgi:hypothetical protein
LPLVVILLPIVIAGLALWLFGALLVLVVVWLTWCPQGRYALVVYSNSPVWQEFFETEMLPRLAGRAAILNWSERQRWRISLPVVLFNLFGGSREFNPVAIVFEPLTWPRRFRFHRAFRSFKTGRREEVENVRREFFALLNKLAPVRAA